MNTITMTDSDRITITISRKTHERLDRLGKRRETFDEIILKCIEAYEEKEKEKHRGDRK